MSTSLYITGLRIALGAALATVLTWVVMALAPADAQASATGCSYFGNLGYVVGVPVYKGNYCAHISGGGTYVNYVSGSFSSYGNICNWTLTAEFFDVNGRWYRTLSTPVRYGCSRTGGAGINVYSHMRRGFMCSTLKQNGGRITSVCHSIS